jgi:hypothetical protein
VANVLVKPSDRSIYLIDTMQGFAQSVAFAGIGTALMASAAGFAMLVAGRLIFATDLNLHNVGAPKMLAAWFQGHPRLGLAMGLYTWAFTLGIFGSLTFLGSLSV